MHLPHIHVFLLNLSVFLLVHLPGLLHGQDVVPDTTVATDTTSIKTEKPYLGKGKFFTIDTAATSISTGADTKAVPKRKPEKNSTATSKRHSPLKAGLFSAALPGLGQVYNRRYWKPPIIYAGFGGLGYAMYYTASNFQTYRSAYRLQVDGDPSTIGSVNGIEDAATLKAYRDYYKRFVDISAIGIAVWYLLNVVDAAVDAHLFEWNMKDDIRVSWKPVSMPAANSAMVQPGVSVSLRF